MATDLQSAVYLMEQKRKESLKRQPATELSPILVLTIFVFLFSLLLSGGTQLARLVG